jgi:hypothetical protein
MPVNGTEILAVKCKTKLITIKSWTILLLPKDESARLPSRGQVMVEGKINGAEFKTPLEPDGNGSHWFRVENKLLDAAHLKSGDTAEIEITPTKSWPEPDVPENWQKAIKADKVASELWSKITPMARWEWIRWARATNNSETRERRIKTGISKMIAGERRPCCWNRNLCTEPSVSKNGVLLSPS